MKNIITLFLVLFLLPCVYAQNSATPETVITYLKGKAYALALENAQALVIKNDDVFNKALYAITLDETALEENKKEALNLFENIYSSITEVEKLNEQQQQIYQEYLLHFGKNLCFYEQAGQCKKSLNLFEQGIIYFSQVSGEYALKAVQRLKKEKQYAENFLKAEKEYQRKVEEREAISSIQNLGPIINTPYSEHSPVLQGGLLYFTSRMPVDIVNPDLFRNDDYNENAYFYNLSQSTVTPLTKMNKSNNHHATNDFVRTSKGLFQITYKGNDNGTICICEIEEAEGPKKGQCKTDTPIKNINTKYTETSFHVQTVGDEVTIIFASDRPSDLKKKIQGTFGGRDLFITKSRSGRLDDFETPPNLGRKINSNYNEDAPNRVSMRGKEYLFFSSDRPESLGGYDIFVSEPEGDPNEGRWLPALNLGYPINSPSDDIYFYLKKDSNLGYFSSDRVGGYGEKDIYKVEPFIPPARYNVFLQVIVKNDRTDFDLTEKAQIRVLEKKNNILVEKKQGSYKLKAGETYNIEVTVEGYTESFQITGEIRSLTTPFPKDKDIHLTEIFYLHDDFEDRVVLERSERFDLGHLYFNLDRSMLRYTRDGTTTLNALLELWKILPKIEGPLDFRIRIQGHTDWCNDCSYNSNLGLARAESAKRYLVQSGVPRELIETKSFSEKKPIKSNEDDLGRQFNRHVEIQVVKWDAQKNQYVDYVRTLPKRPLFIDKRACRSANTYLDCPDLIEDSQE
ncbi:MAG: OmpA family protein [Bacteriovoracaceae bacterium]|nr:OmpA family protein [Bacteriovoracaceae bacterium]